MPGKKPAIPLSEAGYKPPQPARFENAVGTNQSDASEGLNMVLITGS